MQKQVTIDSSGNRLDISPERFQNAAFAKPAHVIESDSSTGITYIAFAVEGTAGQAIQKIVKTTAGTVKKTVIWWAYGSWANRASLTYNLTPADALTVTINE